MLDTREMTRNVLRNMSYFILSYTREMVKNAFRNMSHFILSDSREMSRNALRNINHFILSDSRDMSRNALRNMCHFILSYTREMARNALCVLIKSNHIKLFLPAITGMVSFQMYRHRKHHKSGSTLSVAHVISILPCHLHT